MFNQTDSTSSGTPNPNPKEKSELTKKIPQKQSNLNSFFVNNAPTNNFTNKPAASSSSSVSKAPSSSSSGAGSSEKKSSGSNKKMASAISKLPVHQQRLAQFWTQEQLKARLELLDDSSDDDVFMTDSKSNGKESQSIDLTEETTDPVASSDDPFASTITRRTKVRVDEITADNSVPLPNFTPIQNTSNANGMLSAQNTMDICQIWDFLCIYGHDYLKLDCDIPSLKSLASLLNDPEKEIDFLLKCYSALFSEIRSHPIKYTDDTLQDQLRLWISRQNDIDVDLLTSITTTEIVSLLPITHLQLFQTLINRCLTTETFRAFYEQIESEITKLRQAKWSWSGTKKDLTAKIKQLEDEIIELEKKMEEFKKTDPELIENEIPKEECEPGRQRRRDLQHEKNVKELKLAFKQQLIDQCKAINSKIAALDKCNNQFDEIEKNEREFPARLARMLRRKKGNSDRFLGYDRNMRMYWWVDTEIGNPDANLMEITEVVPFGILIERSNKDEEEGQKPSDWEYIGSIDSLSDLIDALNSNGLTESELRSKLLGRLKTYGVGDSAIFPGSTRDRQMRLEQRKQFVNDSMKGFGEWINILTTVDETQETTKKVDQYRKRMSVSLLQALGAVASMAARFWKCATHEMISSGELLGGITEIPSLAFDESENSEITAIYRTALKYCNKTSKDSSDLLETARNFATNWCDEVIEAITSLAAQNGNNHGIIAMKNRLLQLNERCSVISGFNVWCRDVEGVIRGIIQHHPQTGPPPVVSEMKDLQDTVPEVTERKNGRERKASNKTNGKTASSAVSTDASNGRSARQERSMRRNQDVAESYWAESEDENQPRKKTRNSAKTTAKATNKRTKIERDTDVNESEDEFEETKVIKTPPKKKAKSVKSKRISEFDDFLDDDESEESQESNDDGDESEVEVRPSKKVGRSTAHGKQTKTNGSTRKSTRNSKAKLSSSESEGEEDAIEVDSESDLEKETVSRQNQSARTTRNSARNAKTQPARESEPQRSTRSRTNHKDNDMETDKTDTATFKRDIKSNARTRKLVIDSDED
ncbi:hypothetical protein HK098_003739 [Nowakowskiella sp. JEL0407]|nr:hypothetical protein HK098_003739 [Nowakowskiella sp. JEL0407]